MREESTSAEKRNLLIRFSYVEHESVLEKIRNGETSDDINRQINELVVLLEIAKDYRGE